MSKKTPYDDEFFDDIVGASVTSARRIVPFIVELLAPRSVVDVGCGTGAWLAAFRDSGVTDVLGLDGAYVSRERLAIPPEAFRVVDLLDPPDLGRAFDLATCFEVAEHLPSAASESLIAFLTSLAPAVTFSAAIPGQGGNHHVNERWPDHWVEQFDVHGFVAFDCLRARFWDDEHVAPYYAQNAFLFLRTDHPARSDAEAAASPLPRRLVHPGVFEQHARPKGIGDSLRALPGALRQSVGYRRRG